MKLLKRHPLRIALVHDYLNQYGGAEIVLRWLHHIFPQAPIYTLIYEPDLLPAEFSDWDIRYVGWSRYFPFRRHLYKHYLLLYPSMIEQIDLRDYDLVISSAYLWAKGILTRSDTLHICLCYTPMRQAWELYFENKTSYSKFVSKFIYPFAFSYLKIWDRVAADRVDEFVSISETVKRRIEKYYRRNSKVVYPPVETENISPVKDIGDYYLVLSRLVPYKRVDIAVKAFNELGKKLIIAGTGQQFRALRRMANSNIVFEGFVTPERKIELLKHCKALVFPGEEDFGIVPVEAQAAGRPVIAYGTGGATETIVDGVTGLFFYERTPESLVEAINIAEKIKFDQKEIVANTKRFSVENFINRIRIVVSEYIVEYFGEEHVKDIFKE